MLGGPSGNFLAWVRRQLWERQVPATVLPAPSGGAAVTLDSGQVVVFPGPDAVGWFLAGWEARDREGEAAAADLVLPTEPSEEDQGGE
jgi:hypothetical protein